MRNSFLAFCCLFQFCVLFNSCNRYIDRIQKSTPLPASNSYFRFYTGRNHFEYQSNVLLTKDAENIVPKHFEINLPKDIKYYEIISSSNFAFYYGNDQVVFLKIDLESTKLRSDSIFDATDIEVRRFIEYEIITSRKERYDIKEIPINRSRVTKFIRRDCAMIFLYNIKVDNYEMFLEHVKTFKFL